MNAMRATNCRCHFIFKSTAFDCSKKVIKIRNNFDCMKCSAYCCSYDHIEVRKADVKRLAKHFDGECVAEFGRTYCERYGTDLTMADLVMIAHAQDTKARAALAKEAPRSTWQA